MTKVKKITVSNLKAISELTADFNGCTAIITGGNNKGKSSFLRSLPDRLRQQKPDKILKEGEVEGFAEWELTSGEKLIWEFDSKTKKGEKLTFVTKEEIKTPLTMEIANLFFPKGFDIDKFLNSSPRQQREQLLKIIGVDLSEIEEKYKKAYEDRALQKKLLEIEKGKEMEVFKDAPDREIDETELTQELAGIAAHNDKYKYVRNGMAEKEEQANQIEGQIINYKRLIEEQEALLEKVTEDINRGNAWLNQPKNMPKDADYIVDLEDRLGKIEEDNHKFKHNQKAKEVAKHIKEAEKKVEKAENLVAKIIKEKEDLVKKSDLPAGFEITDDGITYTGLPFTKEQLSSSRIYIGALKLAAMAVGRVRTLHFDASFLDKNSLKEIETWAKQNDLQLLIERPDFEGGEIEYHIIEKQ